MLRHLTIARTLMIILWLLIPVVAVRVQTDTDVWWQLRTGERNLDAGRLVQEETFSYTCDTECPPRIQHEWLGQPVLVAFWRLLGHAGLSLYAVACAMIGMAFVYRTLAGGPYLKAFLLVLGAFSASVFWGARPLMLSFILAAVTIWIVYGYHREGKSRRLWILPLMFALWGNLHGGWPQGALILIAAAAGMMLNWLAFKRVSPQISDPQSTDAIYGVPTAPPANQSVATALRPLITFLIPCILAAVLIPLLNPYGLEMLKVPIDTVGFDFQPQFIEEWRPASLSRPEMWPFFAVLILTVLTMALDWRRADFVEIVMVAGTAYMALTSARHIAFFTTVALVPLSIHAAALGEARGWRLRPTTRVTPSRARFNVFLIVLVSFASLMYLIVRLAPVNVDIALRARLPVDAVEALHEINPPQPMLNSWNFGGYLIYFAPDYPVFIDGRADLYRDFTWTYIDILMAKPIWRDEFETWGIQSVLIEPGTPIADTLRAEAGWSVAYEDEIAVLFVRNGA